MLGIKEIQKIIPHRHPFLLVDCVEELEPGGPRPAPDPAEQTLPPCGGSVPLPPRRR